MLGQTRDLGSGKVPVIFPAPPLADSLTATTRLSPLHVYTSHTRPYTRLSLHGKISRPLALFYGQLKVHDGSNFIPDSSESDLGSKEGSFLAENDDVECIGQNQ